MLTAALLALALVAGVHPVALVLVALAVYQPTAFLFAAAAWALYHTRRRGEQRRALPAIEADYLRAVSAEVEAGASIRRALIAAAARTPELDLGPMARVADAGRPIAEVAARLEAALPANGRIAAAACTLVADTGARASGVFAGLAVRAAAAGDVERERRVLSAQGRITAWLVGGIPAAATVVLLVSGHGPAGSGPGRLIMVAGLALVTTGTALVFAMVRSP
jgi:Flp pilus assembly protein TadB